MGTSSDFSHSYAYNALSRLTQVIHPSLSGLVPEAFSYDSVGNRLSSHLSTRYAYDSANRLLEDDTFTYTYDANGNLIERQVNPCPPSPALCPSTHYTYDVENQLISVERGVDSVEYRYDGLGRRIEKVVLPPSHPATLPLSVRYVYDNEDIVALYDQAGCWRQSILHGPGIDDPYAFIQDTNHDCGPFDAAGFREPIRYLTSDGLGSITSLAAETSGFFRTLVLRERYTYDSFGNLTITDSNGNVLPESQYGNIYYFTGREYDPETGLHYYRHRTYDSFTGRFYQEDPVAGLLRIPSTQHRYVYGHNNPLRFTDPSGEQSVLTGLTALAVGFAVAALFIVLAFESAKEVTKQQAETRQRQSSDAFDIAQAEAERHQRQARFIEKGGLEAITEIANICPLAGDPESAAISLGTGASIETATAVTNATTPQ